MNWFRRSTPRRAREADTHDTAGPSGPNEHYVRPPTDYRRPPCPLWLDGTATFDAVTGWNDAYSFDRVPDGAEIAVEAVLEPGNPHDNTAVALELEGARIGYLPRGIAKNLFPLIVETNTAGFHVLMHAKKHDTQSRSGLEVRGTWPADLAAWLQLPEDVRGTEFFELGWIKTDYRNFYQNNLSRVLGTDPSRIVECSFANGPRTTDPYGYVPGPVGAPAPPKFGTYTDVFVGEVHVGELRLQSMHHGPAEVRSILEGCGTGLAKVQRYGNIDLKVCVPQSPHGDLPRSTQPFLWKEEGRNAEREEQQRTYAARDAEVVDGVPLAHCRYVLADLKRAGDLTAAAVLAQKMVDAAQVAAGLEKRAPQSWVTLDAAVVLRKLNDVDGEIKVLERYLACCPPSTEDEKVVARLAKARQITSRTGKQVCE